MPKHFLIPADLLHAVGLYLMARPMSEVEQLVNGLRQCQPHEPPAEVLLTSVEMHES